MALYLIFADTDMFLQFLFWCGLIGNLQSTVRDSLLAWWSLQRVLNCFKTSLLDFFGVILLWNSFGLIQGIFLVPGSINCREPTYENCRTFTSVETTEWEQGWHLIVIFMNIKFIQQSFGEPFIILFFNHGKWKQIMLETDESTRKPKSKWETTFKPIFYIKVSC